MCLQQTGQVPDHSRLMAQNPVKINLFSSTLLLITIFFQFQSHVSPYTLLDVSQFDSSRLMYFIVNNQLKAHMFIAKENNCTFMYSMFFSKSHDSSCLLKFWYYVWNSLLCGSLGTSKEKICYVRLSFRPSL